MAKYIITLRREKSEIAISISEIETDTIVYKNGFFASVDYFKDKRFEELSNKFLEYMDQSIIQFRNLGRYFDLLKRLLKNNMLDFNNIKIDEELNIVKIIGGKNEDLHNTNI